MKAHLQRWMAWFFLANALTYLIIGCSFLTLSPHLSEVPYLAFKGKILTAIFLGTSYMGHYALLALLAALIPLALSFFVHNKYFIGTLSIFLASLMVIILIIDSFVYHHFHFHLSGVVWEMLKNGVLNEVLVLTWLEKLFIFIIIVVVFIFEGVVAVWIWKNWAAKKFSGLIPVFLGSSLFISYVLMTEAYALSTEEADALQSTHLVMMEAQLIPFYDNILGGLTLRNQGSLKLQTRGEGIFLQLEQVNKPLHYPLNPLISENEKKEKSPPLNILFIVLDDWRFDMLTPTMTPHIYQFSKKAWYFNNHYSAGNATGPGIFSLFYSVPYSYWSAMLEQEQGPVFLHTLFQQRYMMGVYRSASMKFPAFDETVFREVPSLQIEPPGKISYDRDRMITNQFLNFLNTRNTHKPFFGFLFYDATHNYCESVPHYLKPFEPAVKVCDRLNLTQHSDPLPYLNRYKNAVYYVDGLIEEVLKQLKQQGLLDKTIVVITADHGEEFNENHGDFWGHASDYTHWQLHVPLIIYWPGQQPKIIHHLTTHYDVIPYLMQNALHIKNSMSDYSVGQSLLADEQRHFFVAASYIDYAMITPSTITRVYPQGNYVIKDETGKTLPNQSLDPELLKKTFEQLNRYFQ